MEVKAFDKFSTPRIAQLIQRSNQFNLRTIRYTEEDVERISLSKKYNTVSFSLTDKFGDYGLISALILEQKDNSFFIDTWIMSCRVLKRGVEKFILEELFNLAKNKKIKSILGEYIETPKNVLVKDLYQDLGFKNTGNNKWELVVEEISLQEHHISRK